MTHVSKPLLQTKAQVRLAVGAHQPEHSARILQTHNPRVLKIVPVADQVGDIRVNSVTGRVYFDHSDNQIGVLDGNTNQVIGNVGTGDGTAFLAVNTRTNRVYATNFRAGTVSVISGITNKLITNVSVGEHPFGIAIHRGRNRIYVANTSGTIVIIDGGTNRILQTLKVGGSPALVAVNERTNRIYVTNVGKDSVHVINGLTMRLIKTIKVGRNPIITPGILPQTNRIFVANNLSRFASVISGSTLGKSTPIQLGRRQSEIAVNPLTNRIYITSAQQVGKGKLYVINGQTNTIIRSLSIPTFSSLLVNPLSNRFYIGDSETRDLFVYNGLTNSLLVKLRTGLSAGNMTLNTRSNRIYVGNERSITVIQDSR
ncbi:YncE family protein [Paenibacillus aceris]|uniref:YVTN family beta-propeller protein n=1 Tax=Paenibacillus aceris TaxID=869555 RepID=A0ABS4HZE5_9BACL|nr:YncE family protein [Paenibacillus aceris]MBP1963923.1 YVTN family beta-propeller protein [Paenibacillus aceris]NHW34658.1 YncE family protein [Paenibacillus aceris]